MDGLIMRNEELKSLKERLRQKAAPEADHHRGLAEALLTELRRVTPESARSFEKMVTRWSWFDDAQRRKYLRLAVAALREGQANTLEALRQVRDGLHGLGIGAIEEIYGLEPDMALARAQDLALTLVQTKTAATTVRDLDEGLGPEGKNGKAQLLDRLGQKLAQDGLLLVAALERVGGAVLDRQKRAELTDLFDKISHVAGHKDRDTP